MQNDANLSEVFTDLVRAQIRLWNGVDADLREHAGQSLAGLESLRAVAARLDQGLGTCRVNDVADDLVITVGGASKIVDRLERAGSVVRRPNPDDRRSSLVDLTPAGRAELARVTPFYDEALRRRLGERLDPAELAALARAVRRLRATP
jgi:DNA-binding MarR family transcriptional regulator